MNKEKQERRESETSTTSEKEILSQFSFRQAVICKGCKRLLPLGSSGVDVTFPRGNLSLVRIYDPRCRQLFDYAPSEVLRPTDEVDRGHETEEIARIKQELKNLEGRVKAVESKQTGFWEDVEKAKQRLETSITKFVAEKLGESAKKEAAKKSRAYTA